MKTLLRNRPLKNNKGMAVIETLSVMIIFFIMFYYTIGFWGITHTAILHSISARTYSYEIFRHRSSLWYFRGNKRFDSFTYHDTAVRLHGVNSEAANSTSNQYATERRIAMFQENPDIGRSTSEHDKILNEIQAGSRNETISVDPVWIKIQYGICLTPECGE